MWFSIPFVMVCCVIKLCNKDGNGEEGFCVKFFDRINKRDNRNNKLKSSPRNPAIRKQ